MAQLLPRPVVYVVGLLCSLHHDRDAVDGRREAERAAQYVFNDSIGHSAYGSTDITAKDVEEQAKTLLKGVNIRMLVAGNIYKDVRHPVAAMS